METAAHAAGIIAIVETIKRHVPGVNGSVTVVIAIVVGAVLGYFGLDGLTVQSGIAAALLGVGGHTVFSK